MPQHPPAGEVVISMRPVSVFANGPESEIEQLQAALQGRWRQATRAVMVLLSLHGLPVPLGSSICRVTCQSSVRQAACAYSLIKPLRTRFRRICCMSTSVTVPR